jgi:hypothetical protein
VLGEGLFCRAITETKPWIATLVSQEISHQDRHRRDAKARSFQRGYWITNEL